MKSFSLDEPRLRILVCGFGRIAANRWNYSDVSLPHWRLYWNSSSGAHIWTKNISIEMKPSSAVLLAPNTVFSTVNEQSVNHMYIHFQMPSFFVESRPPIAAVPIDEPLLAIARDLVSMISSGGESKWKLSLTARSLVSLALAKLEMKMTELPCRDGRVLNVVNYIDEHLQTDSSNETLARQAGMSVGALSRLFKDQVGHSLQEYARRKRIEKACLMLQFSAKSIEEIVEVTGFCDRYHFSRVFKSIQGVSPAAFRRLHSMPPSS